MDLQRRIRAVANNMAPSPGKSPPVEHTQHSSAQGIASLIVMLVVLTIIILFCCFAAPGIRGMCKRYIFRTCQIDDPDRDNASQSAGREPATPTVILLPYGRMLIVDRHVLGQLRPDRSGVDLVELSARVMRAQSDSTASLLDSDATGKGATPDSPPAYREIFGAEAGKPDLPPSYSELELGLAFDGHGSRSIGSGEAMETDGADRSAARRAERESFVDVDGNGAENDRDGVGDECGVVTMRESSI